MRLVALVPCDLVRVDTGTGKIAILGPFELLAGPLPLGMRFYVYARAECAPGKHNVEVSIRRQGFIAVAVRMTAEPDVKCAGETGMLNLSFGPVALMFKEEGRYVVEAFGDGELLGSAWFDVVKKAVLFLPGKNGAQIPTFDQARR